MVTVKVFKLGTAQAVRIPARYRLRVSEVEIFQRGDELVLRPKSRSALDVFEAARAVGGDLGDWKRPAQGKARSVLPLD